MNEIEVCSSPPWLNAIYEPTPPLIGPTPHDAYITTGTSALLWNESRFWHKMCSFEKTRLVKSSCLTTFSCLDWPARTHRNPVIISWIKDWLLDEPFPAWCGPCVFIIPLLPRVWLKIIQLACKDYLRPIRIDRVSGFSSIWRLACDSTCSYAG